MNQNTLESLCRWRLSVKVESLRHPPCVPITENEDCRVLVGRLVTDT